MSLNIRRFLIICTIFTFFSAGGSIAQVDYNKKDQRNPSGDPQVEKGFQDHQRQYQREQQAERLQKQDGIPHSEKQFQKQQFGGPDEFNVKKTQQVQ